MSSIVAILKANREERVHLYIFAFLTFQPILICAQFPSAGPENINFSIIDIHGPIFWKYIIGFLKCSYNSYISYWLLK